jgi:lipoprotein-releasing system permease protein
MLKFFLALRYLKKTKIVLLSIISVALSTALLVTVASLFTAFIEAVESSASDYMGDIVLEPPAEFSNSDEFVARLYAAKEISAASIVLSTNGLVHFGPGDVKAVTIWGIDIADRCKVTGIKNSLLEQSKLSSVPKFTNDVNTSGTIPAFVGIGLFAEPDAKTDEYDLPFVKSFIGKNAVITVGSAQKETQSGSPFAGLKSRSAGIKISDIVLTSVYDIDKRFVFVPVDRLADILDKQGQKPADIVHIKCADGFDPAQTVPVVRRIWAEFAAEKLNWPPFYIAQTEIMTSVAKQSQYTAELRKQMGVLLVIFGIISAGVVVLVFCIFYMIVTSKRKDLAIIKSIGGSSFASASIFLYFGLFIGLIGAFLGLSIGYIFTHNVNVLEQWISVVFGLKLWSSSIYMFNRIPSSFNWYWAWWFFGAAVTASVLGALAPAIAAARTNPAEILRYE